MNTATSNPRLRRKYPRRNLSRPVGVLFHGRYFLCSAMDVSESGVSIDITAAHNAETCLALQNDDDVLVTFKLPSSEFIVARAVVHGKKHGLQSVPVLKDKPRQQVALSFHELTLHQRRLIRDFVSSKAAGEDVHTIELDPD
jgi:hypothetical protein